MPSYFCYKVRLCFFPLNRDWPAETNESIIIVCRWDSPTDTANLVSVPVSFDWVYYIGAADYQFKWNDLENFFYCRCDASRGTCEEYNSNHLCTPCVYLFIFLSFSLEPKPFRQQKALEHVLNRKNINKKENRRKRSKSNSVRWGCGLTENAIKKLYNFVYCAVRQRKYIVIELFCVLKLLSHSQFFFWLVWHIS